MSKFKQWAVGIGIKHLGGGEGIVVQVACLVASVVYMAMAINM